MNAVELVLLIVAWIAFSAWVTIAFCCIAHRDDDDDKPGT